MKQDDPQFKLRLPPDLKEQLEIAAKVNSRTLGAEVVARLRQSMKPVATVVSLKWGTEGHILNVGLPEVYLNEVVRPDIISAIRDGLERWKAEESEEGFEPARRAEIQLVARKRA